MDRSNFEDLAHWHDTLVTNMFEVIMPPSAMGSGHRGLAHKASLIVYSWALGAPPQQDFRSIALSYASFTSDMGVEMSIPEFACRDPTVLVPE